MLSNCLDSTLIDTSRLSCSRSDLPEVDLRIQRHLGFPKKRQFNIPDVYFWPLSQQFTAHLSKNQFATWQLTSAISSIFSFGMRTNQNVDTTSSGFYFYFYFYFYLTFLLSFFSHFLLWFCKTVSRLCSRWKSFHLNFGESELFLQDMFTSFFDFEGKLPSYFVRISGQFIVSCSFRNDFLDVLLLYQLNIKADIFWREK